MCASPEESKQAIELKVTEVFHVGPSDASTYPGTRPNMSRAHSFINVAAVAKTKLSLEYLRSIMHFRVRTNTISAVTRIRNSLASATHRFFQVITLFFACISYPHWAQQHGFMYVNTPLITSSDCEGAGEMFQVTTLLQTAEELHKTPIPTSEDIQRAEGTCVLVFIKLLF